MWLRGAACRLTIFVGESHLWHHRPVYAEIIHRAHRAGPAGASAFPGVEGFSASSRIHAERLLTVGRVLPIAIVIVDEEWRIRAFLPQLDEVVSQGLVVIEDVEVYRSVTGESRREPVGNS